MLVDIFCYLETEQGELPLPIFSLLSLDNYLLEVALYLANRYGRGI